MYNPSVSGGNASSVAGSRLFVYEVKGLRQNAETDKMDTIPFVRVAVSSSQSPTTG
jgi:hypothetical protein